MVNNNTYIDTSVLISWILYIQAHKKSRRLPPKSQKCIELFNYIANGDINSAFIISDWTMSEMIQTFVDRVIFRQFFLDGHEISSFNRMKNNYDVSKRDITIINKSITEFEWVLKNLGMTFMRTQIDWKKVHHYCMTHKLETPDAIHFHNAVDNNSDYLVTADNQFTKIDSQIHKVLDPSHLISLRSTKKKK